MELIESRFSLQKQKKENLKNQMKHKVLWGLWAKSLGQRPENVKDHEADKIAIIRTFMFVITLLLPGIMIIANGIRHWNDDYTPAKIEIIYHHEKTNSH